MRIFSQFNRLVFGKIMLSLSNFAILFLLSNFYPASFTGTFYYQVTLISTLAIFLGLGADNSLFFFVKKNMISLPGLVALGYRLVYFFLLIVAVALFLKYLSLFDNALLIVFSCAFICSCLMQNIFNAYLSGKRQGWKLQLIFFLTNVFFIFFLLADIHTGKARNIELLLYVFYGINFLVSLLVLVVMQYQMKPIATVFPSKKLLKKIIRFGLLAYISNSIFFLGANIDLFLIKLLCNSKLTVYVQAIKIFQMICSVAYLLYYPFMGKILTSSYQEGIDALLKAGRIIISALVLLMIPFYLACYLFLDKIFPANAKEIFMLLLLLSVSVIATSAAYLYTSYFVATKKYKQNLFSALIFLVTVTTLCLLLIPRIGVYGGALAYSAAILASLMFDILYIVRSINTNLTTAFLLTRNDIKFIKSLL